MSAMMQQVLLLLFFLQSFTVVSNVHPYVGPYDPGLNRAGQPYDRVGPPYDSVIRRQEILFIAFGQINHNSGYCLH